MPNHDELKGKSKQATGAAREKVGEWTGDPALEDECAAERTEGDVQEKWGEGKRQVGEAIEDAGKKIKE
ncbi:MAG: CsbD family protein [Gemmatimonadota bacterium]